jgi:hypothetical protein
VGDWNGVATLQPGCWEMQERMKLFFHNNIHLAEWKCSLFVLAVVSEDEHKARSTRLAWVLGALASTRPPSCCFFENLFHFGAQLSASVIQ